MASPTPPRQEIDAVRRFNRFYTRQIGVLQEGVLHSPFSLTDARVLYEIAHRDRPTATDLAKALELDGGYLSRILQRFARRRLITRTSSKTDGRQTHLALTAHGRETFEPLQQLARDEIATLLRRVTPEDRRRLLEAMHTIESCLGKRGAQDDRDDCGAEGDQDARPEHGIARAAGAATAPMASKAAGRALPAPEAEPFTLRTHQPGDMGWIVHRHGAIYAQEYGWNAEFEALVAEIAAQFLRTFNPARERCWMAERHGAIVGSVMLVRQSDDVAKLRLLLVESSARGLGIGKRLVDECVRFARETGYRTITLWTQANLSAARGIYKAAGFQLVAHSPKPAFGHDDLVSETWQLTL